MSADYESYFIEVQIEPRETEAERSGVFQITLIDHEVTGALQSRGTTVLAFDNETLALDGLQMAVPAFLEQFYAGRTSLPEAGKAFGRMLAQRLFADQDVKTGWDAIKTRRGARPLYLQLTLPRNPNVALLPFELLADDNGFFFSNVGSAIVRTPAGLPTKTVSLPAENGSLLVTWANPPGTDTIDLSVIKAHAQDVTKAAQEIGITLHDPICARASLKTLDARLRTQPTDIVSLIAHGDPDGGRLAVHSDEASDVRRDVSPDELARVFKAGNVKIAFLWVCHGAQSHPHFGAFAARLLHPDGGNLSAVVASHAAIRQSKSAEIAIRIFRQLGAAADGDLGQAVSASRTVMSDGDLQWAAMVYYARPRAGQSVNLPRPRVGSESKIIADSVRNSADSISLDNIENNFRQGEIEWHKNLRLSMPSLGSIEVPIEDVHVDLKVVNAIPKNADTFTARERQILASIGDASEVAREALWREFDAHRFDRHQTPASISSAYWFGSALEVFAVSPPKVVVLLGEPGSGKTTLLRLLALRAARKSKISTGDKPLPLPIFLPLASYDDYHRTTKELPKLQDFLAVHFSKDKHFEGGKSIFERAFHEGRALVLLDGLDEVMFTPRQTIVNQVEGLIRNAPPGNQFVVTSRFVGYHQASLPKEFKHLWVLDFGDREIALFLERWYQVLESRDSTVIFEERRARADVHRSAMLNEIRGNPDLFALAKNPLHLRMLAFLRSQNAQLPTRRVEIFDKFLATLLEQRHEERSSGARTTTVLQRPVPELREYLQDLALSMHQYDQNRTVNRRQVLQTLADTWVKINCSDTDKLSRTEQAKSKEEAEKVLGDLHKVTGIIVERGYDAFGFSHRTYREFFVAEALERMPDATRWETVRLVLHDPGWREALFLCAGHLGILQGQSDAVDQLVRHVLNANSPFESLLFRDVFLAADMVAADVGASDTLMNEIKARLDDVLRVDKRLLQERANERVAGLARVGHESSIDWLIRCMKYEVDEYPRAIVTDAQRNVGRLLGASKCAKITNWVTRNIDDWLRQETELASYKEDKPHWFHSGIRYLGKTRPDFLRQLIKKVDAGWYVPGVFFEFGARIKTDHQIRDALIRWAKKSHNRQPALLALAERIPEDEKVEPLLEAAWDEHNDGIRHAVLVGAVNLAPTRSKWRERILDSISDTKVTALAKRDPNALARIGMLVKSVPDVRKRYLELMRGPNLDAAAVAATVFAPLLCDDPALRAEILAHLKRPEETLRHNAVSHLKTLAHTEGEFGNALRLMLADSAHSVRGAALEVLSPFAYDDEVLRKQFIAALDATNGCLLTDRIDTVAPLARWDETTLLRIQAFLTHREPQVRSVSIRALGPLAADNAVLRGELLTRLEDSDVNVQIRAIHALGPCISSDATLVKKLVEVASDANLREEVLEVLAPFHANDVVRELLVSQLEGEPKRLGVVAAATVAELAKSDELIRSLIRDMAADETSLKQIGLDTAFNVFDAFIEEDEFVRERIYKYTHNEHLNNQVWQLLLRHPKLPCAKKEFMRKSKSSEPWRRADAVDGLSKLARGDTEARNRLLELLEDKEIFGFLDRAAETLNVLLDDDDIRTRLLAATKVRFPAIPLRCLISGVAAFDDVKTRFRELLKERQRLISQEPPHAQVAALGLAPFAS